MYASIAIPLVPAASPSSPSVRFTAFAKPLITRNTITKNTYGPTSKTRSTTGTCSVVLKPVTRTATSTNASDTTASSSIRHLPASPPERRRQTFIRSSARPINPQATVVASTSMAWVLRVDKIKNGSAVATRIRTPPIVGVPCFCAWASGIMPSALMNCPTSLRRSQAMNLGPKNISSVAALIAAIKTRSTG